MPMQASPGAFAPLANPVYRNLWITWAAANLTMWMNDVAAAWLMTSLTTSPVMVALVQTASTLPVFLLGLPSGALADILDRRKYYAATQMWVAVIALVLAGMALVDGLTAPVLLALTFANGIGLALRWPVFSAIVPAIVERAHMPNALALNGISMNLARVVGPMLAGAMLASLGVASVFALNALLAVMSTWLILRWKSERQASQLPGERFIGAMRVGVQHVRESPRMRLVLLRIFLFFLQSSSVVALLPLIAREQGGGRASAFTAMLACTGIGAIIAALSFPRWRARWGRDRFVLASTLVHAAASVGLVFSPSLWLSLPLLVISGMAWISAANTLAITAQLALPDWVRARGMSIYQMALMGGAAAGSMLWGKVASLTSVPIAVSVASACGAAYIVLTRRRSLERGEDHDWSPRQAASGVVQPAWEIGPDEGPVMVTIEYAIDPARAREFDAIMRKTGQARRRQGVLSWGLFRDIADPGRYIEYYVDENWTEHLRRLERFTAADEGLRDQRAALHEGDGPPRIRRYIADREVE